MNHPRIWFAGALSACALSLAVAHGQTQVPQPQESPQLDLRLDRGLSELSYERLADGSAAALPAPLPVPVIDEPTAVRPFSTLPAMLLGGVLLALTAFAAGVLTVRRRPVVERDPGAPVQLWADSEALEQELETLREQLAEQQLLNESLQADRDAREEELAGMRRERDDAAGESQVLRMRADDDELNRAHETIDELRVEIERLRGADSDLERDPHSFEGDEPEALRAGLEARDLHIHELEEVMSTVRAERDGFEQSLGGRDAQIQALEHTLGDRDEELELLQGELRRAQEQSGEAAEERIRALADEVETVRSDAAREVEELQDRLNERHEAEERVEELQRRNQEFGSELGERRDELIQLAEQNDRLKAHMRDLEFALKRDEDLTTRLELGGLDFGDDAEGIGPPSGFQATLDQAEQRVVELENELREAKQQIGQVGDSDAVDLQRQNIKLSAMILQRDNIVAELEAQVAALQGDSQPGQEWTSTVKLEDELRPAEEPAQTHDVDRHSPSVEAGADTETLSRTVSSRQNLVDSLQAILEEQSKALSSARKIASERADLLVSFENEIASNRITIAALQNRASHAHEHGSAAPSGETQRLERELQRGARMIEKLRTDLHKWRRRVRPLHEAVMLRDNRIKSLDAQLRALRDAGLDAMIPSPDAVMFAGSGTDAEQPERDRYFKLIAGLHEDIERLEDDLAETGLEMSRVQAADENQVLEIENLEAARAAQALRMDELRHELMTLGVNSELPGADADNVVELQAHRTTS